jgi:hypothetical protein
MRTGLLLLLLAGCAGSPTPSQPPNETAPVPEMSDVERADLARLDALLHAPGTVVARLGETVRVGDVEIRPLEVLEDSRCPLDAHCVWAGRIRVKVAVRGAGEPAMEIGRPVPLPGGRALRLVAAAPPRWARPPRGVDPNAPLRFAFRLDPQPE